MSEIVDQIDKLKGKAHALKESVSVHINIQYLTFTLSHYRENIWKL